MMLKRVMGKACFATLQDMSGRIQLYVDARRVGAETLDAFKHWDLGDIVGANGALFKTKTGELSVKCGSVRLLSKALRPLPEKFHGLTDQEQRYRQRYVDLITNPDARDVFAKRSQLVQAIREFFVARGFLEVETPMMHPIPGGAAARPFATHHNALDMELYLRIAPELYLKRLVVGGLEKVFEINRNFRNEGISTRHNPEFTMLEFYEAYRDYRYLMDLTETLLRDVAQKCLRHHDARLPGRDDRPRAAVRPADDGRGDQAVTIRSIRGVGPRRCRDYLKRALAPFGVEVFATDGIGHPAAQAVRGDDRGEARPADVHRRASDGCLAARARERRDPAITDRFELFIAGREIANGFSELNDPEDQAARFRRAGEGQGSGRRRGDVLRRRLHPRAGVRPAAHGRRGHRHRSPGRCC